MASISFQILVALAQLPGNWQQKQGQILKLSLVLVVILLIMWGVVHKLRSWMRGTKESEFVTFTFDDLRQMKADGRMSEEEFDQMRASLVKSARRMLGEKSQNPPAAIGEKTAAPDPSFRLLEEDSEELEEDPESGPAPDSGESAGKPDNLPENPSKQPEDDDEQPRGMS